MKSKLFTPKLREAQATYMDAQEGGNFLTPPTHPEVPVFHASTDSGEAPMPLKLSGGGGPSTKTVKRRGITTEPQERFKY